MNHVQTSTMYIRQMYKIIFLCTCLDKQKLTQGGIKLRTSPIVSSSLNHCARSIDATRYTNKVHVYCSTWRLVTYVRCRTSRPSSPHHDVAGQSLHMDFFKTEPSGEAGLGGADVAEHSGPMEEEPATRKVAGCCAADILP